MENKFTENYADFCLYELIGDISKFTCKAFSAESDSLGVAVGYRSILFYLAKKDGVTQLELSRLTGLKPPTISVSLQKMENEGLVDRTSDKEDLRKTIVTLTEKGRTIVNHVSETLRDCDRAISDCLTSDEVETLKHLLTKVRTKIISESEDTPSK